MVEHEHVVVGKKDGVTLLHLAAGDARADLLQVKIQHRVRKTSTLENSIKNPTIYAIKILILCIETVVDMGSNCAFLIPAGHR